MDCETDSKTNPTSRILLNSADLEQSGSISERLMGDGERFKSISTPSTSFSISHTGSSDSNGGDGERQKLIENRLDAILSPNWSLTNKFENTTRSESSHYNGHDSFELEINQRESQGYTSQHWQDLNHRDSQVLQHWHELNHQEFQDEYPVHKHEIDHRKSQGAFQEDRHDRNYTETPEVLSESRDIPHNHGLEHFDRKNNHFQPRHGFNVTESLDMTQNANVQASSFQPHDSHLKFEFLPLDEYVELSPTYQQNVVDNCSFSEPHSNTYQNLLDTSEKMLDIARSSSSELKARSPSKMIETLSNQSSTDCIARINESMDKYKVESSDKVLPSSCKSSPIKHPISSTSQSLEPYMKPVDNSTHTHKTSFTDARETSSFANYVDSQDFSPSVQLSASFSENTLPPSDCDKLSGIMPAVSKCDSLRCGEAAESRGEMTG